MTKKTQLYIIRRKSGDTMLNNRKYILQKTAKYAFCTLLIMTTINQSLSLLKPQIPYTKEDIKNNKQYVQDIRKINYKAPTITNQDLLQELIIQGINLESPEKVTSITITNTLINNDLSELKYFKNLTELNIENNDIDLSDLKYNYNLLSLRLKNGTVSNTKDIPNSIYNLEIHDTVVNDESLEIPYNTKYLTITNTPFSNLYLKNPDRLKRLVLIGNSYLDLTSIKDCNRLNHLTLHRIANVSNSNILTSLQQKSLKAIELDDYAPIWIDKETYISLGLNDEATINEIEQLDKLAASLIDEKDTEETKIKKITTYILENLSYDKEITEDELTDYNDNPINYSLNKKKAICINYASLFTALSNRIGLDTYQIYSDVHTWNMINSNEQSFIDLTMLDDQTIVEILTENGKSYEELDIPSLDLINNNQEQDLYHYHITLEELMNDNNLSKFTALPVTKAVNNNNIGFVNQSGITIEHNNKLYYIEYSKLNQLVLTITVLILFAMMTKKDKNKKYTLELMQ